MHRIAVVALHNVLPFDLATPCEVFARVAVPGGGAGYRIRVCGEAPMVKAGLIDVATHWTLRELANADTVIVPGIGDVRAPASSTVTAAIRRAAARGARVASICTGAFVLAQAGVLDGLCATTHWLAAPYLARRYPAIEVRADELYTDNGQILTSAGAACGIDLCLAMIRRDYGVEVALAASRAAVVPLERAGGQAQFIVDQPMPNAPTLGPLLHWLEQHIAEPVNLAQIARRAAMSTRTLNRRFLDETGTTPLQWVQRVRVRRAQRLLETTDLAIEEVAVKSGFDSAGALRDRFRRTIRATPAGYRRAFRS